MIRGARLKNGILNRRKKITTMTIEALDRDFIKYGDPFFFTRLSADEILRSPKPPPGWVKCVHPEGVRYFYNVEEVRFPNPMSTSYSRL